MNIDEEKCSQQPHSVVHSSTYAVFLQQSYLTDGPVVSAFGGLYACCFGDREQGCI